MVRLNLSFLKTLLATDARLARRQRIATSRSQWRAQMFRRLVQLGPSQSILQIGCGSTPLTEHLREVSRGENPISSGRVDGGWRNIVTMSDATNGAEESDCHNPQAGRAFDCIVGRNVLTKATCEASLYRMHELLKPGGQLVLFESRRPIAETADDSTANKSGDRPSVGSSQGRLLLQRLASQIGLRMDVIPYHECQGLLSSRLTSMFPSFPLLADSMPGADLSAECFVVYAQRPPYGVRSPARSVCEHSDLYRSTSCVVPCYNEEMNLEPLVNGLLSHFGDYIHEIILVDDSSLDGTRDVMQRLAENDSRVQPVVRSGPNGVGQAIADGYRRATGRYVLSLDCDFHQILSEFRDLFDAVTDGADIAIGSRFTRGAMMLNYPSSKLVANRGFHMLARLMLRRKFHDLTNNLKLMRRDVLESLDLTETGFAVNAQTGLLPLMSGHVVREIPVSWINRDEQMGKSSFRLLISGVAYGRALCRLWTRSMSASWNQRMVTPTTETASLQQTVLGESKYDVRD